jgi:hypothetical protein
MTMQRVARAFLEAFLWIHFLSNSFPSYAEQLESFNVSIVSLISNPEKYDGKRIAVTGFLHIEFEDTAIYLNQDDYQHNISKNGLWVSLPEDRDSISHFPGGCQSDRYVKLVGVFSSKFTGHMGAWNGSINTESCNIH